MTDMNDIAGANPDDDPIKAAVRKAVTGGGDPMVATPVAGNAGIAPGEMDPNAGPAPVIDSPMATPPLMDGPKPTRDFSRLAGYNEDKFNANKDDAKYQMGGVLSGFDPRQGITPDVLAALNKLGYGNFSGQGDKLSLSGLTDAGRKANLTGDYKDADFVQGLHGGNGKWGYADPAAEAAQGGMDPAGAVPNPLMNTMPGGVGGNAALGSEDFFKQLMQRAQAAAGPGAMDQNALLSQMGK